VWAIIYRKGREISSPPGGKEVALTKRSVVAKKKRPPQKAALTAKLKIEIRVEAWRGAGR
jgi:hypothetical protein